MKITWLKSKIIFLIIRNYFPLVLFHTHLEWDMGPPVPRNGKNCCRNLMLFSNGLFFATPFPKIGQNVFGIFVKPFKICFIISNPFMFFIKTQERFSRQASNGCRIFRVRGSAKCLGGRNDILLLGKTLKFMELFQKYA